MGLNEIPEYEAKIWFLKNPSNCFYASECYVSDGYVTASGSWSSSKAVWMNYTWPMDSIRYIEWKEIEWVER